MKRFCMSALVVALALVGCTKHEHVVVPSVLKSTTQAQEVIHAPAKAVDANHAIKLAQEKTGGVAVELKAHGMAGKTAIYDIETITATHEYRVQIDARTGQVLSVFKEVEMNVLPMPKLSLAQALGIAQKHIQGGRVYEISLDQEVIGSHYEAKILAEYPYELRIDASTGQVLSAHVEYDD